MKKYLSLIGLAIGLFLLPFVVHASIDASEGFCTNKQDVDGYVTCTFAAKIVDETAFQVTLTEKGGADITEIEAVSGSEWAIEKSENENVWTVSLRYDSPEPSEGEVSLFTYKYKKSGTEDCKVSIAVSGKDYDVTPEEETKKPTGKCVKTDGKYYINGEEVTEEEFKNACPKTGVTLPYVGLLVIATLATGAYIVTRNKTKMYKL